MQALEDDFLSEVVRRKLHLDDDALREMLAELRRQQCDVIALQVREFEAMKRRLEERLAAEVRKYSNVENISRIIIYLKYLSINFFQKSSDSAPSKPTRSDGPTAAELLETHQKQKQRMKGLQKAEKEKIDERLKRKLQTKSKRKQLRQDSYSDDDFESDDET